MKSVIYNILSILTPILLIFGILFLIEGCAAFNSNDSILETSAFYKYMLILLSIVIVETIRLTMKLDE